MRESGLRNSLYSKKFSWFNDPKLKGNICREILATIKQAVLLISPENDFYHEFDMDDMDQELPNSGLIEAEEMFDDLFVKKFEYWKKTCERFLLAPDGQQFGQVNEEKARREKEYGQMKQRKANNA